MDGVLFRAALPIDDAEESIPLAVPDLIDPVHFRPNAEQSYVAATLAFEIVERPSAHYRSSET